MFTREFTALHVIYTFGNFKNITISSILWNIKENFQHYIQRTVYIVPEFADLHTIGSREETEEVKEFEEVRKTAQQQ